MSCTVMMIWFSILMGFVFDGTFTNSFIYPGGLHGYNVSNWLISQIGMPGVGLLLLVTAILFCVYLSRETMQSVRKTLHPQFKRKEPTTTDIPETNEESDSFINYITGKNGVLEKWFRCGASGVRLDVADELPDKFIDELSKSVKGLNDDYFIIGEVWEDATNKISHGGRRRYLLGNQLDRVMNYPFASAIITFMRYGVAESFMESIVSICENYPPQALNCLMNHIGTHDTARILTKLVNDSIEHKPRHIQAQYHLTEEEYEKAKRLLKTATVLQYTLPGFPSIYYGDEAGVQGGADPFNRSFFPWGKEDNDLVEWYRKLGDIRKSLNCLKEGKFIPYSAMLSCVAYIRRSEEDKILVIANKNYHDIDYNLPEEFRFSEDLISGKVSDYSINVPAYGAVILKTKSN